MGIALHSVHLLSSILPFLGDLVKKKVLTLGVQDCYFTYDEILSFLRRHKIPHTEVRPDEVLLTSGQLLRVLLATGRKITPTEAQKYCNYIHQKTLFTLLGFSSGNIHSMDVSTWEGAEIVHDLNLPISESLAGKFDLIYDGGTIEHVFSIKDALLNMCRLCKVGGLVINGSPVDYINHGFVNLNSEIFRDCYLNNGFEEVTLKYVATSTHLGRFKQHYLEFSPDRFLYSLQPYYLTEVFSVYRKVKEMPLKVPLQGSYVRLDRMGSEPARQRDNRLREMFFRIARDWVDAHFVSCVLIRGFVNLRRGKRVKL